MAQQFSYTNPTLPSSSATASQAYGRLNPDIKSKGLLSKNLEVKYEIWQDATARQESVEPLATFEVCVCNKTNTQGERIYIEWDNVFPTQSSVDFSDEEALTDALVEAIYIYIKTLDDFNGIDLTQSTDV